MIGVLAVTVFLDRETTRGSEGLAATLEGRAEGDLSRFTPATLRGGREPVDTTSGFDMALTPATATNSPSEAVRDWPSGRSPEQHLEALNAYHREFISTCVENGGTSRGEILQAIMGLTSQSVAAIMRVQGRADYTRDSTGGMKLRILPDEWQFMVGPARFAFPKGEFVAYDLVSERLQRQPADPSALPVFSEGELIEYEQLYESAVLAVTSQM